MRAMVLIDNEDIWCHKPNISPAVQNIPQVLKLLVLPVLSDILRFRNMRSDSTTGKKRKNAQMDSKSNTTLTP